MDNTQGVCVCHAAGQAVIMSFDLLQLWSCQVRSCFACCVLLVHTASCLGFHTLRQPSHTCCCCRCVHAMQRKRHETEGKATLEQQRREKILLQVGTTWDRARSRP